MPLISFGRALPVGVESRCEWFAITLREQLPARELIDKLNAFVPQGLSAFRADPTDAKGRTAQSWGERFSIYCQSEALGAALREAFHILMNKNQQICVFQTKKGPREINIRPLISDWIAEDRSKDLAVTFTADWRITYLSPLKLLIAIMGLAGKGQSELARIRLVKTAQLF